jgi:hypothetical protein
MSKNYLMLHLKLLEKQEQAKSKTRREIIKISAENNKIEIKKYIELMKQKVESLKT